MPSVTTRFAIGDRVYPVDSEHETVRVPCAACEGQGKVLDGLGERESYCHSPGCHQGSHTLRYSVRATAGSPVTIGRVSLEMYASSGDDPERYMCEETGIGSGRVYYGNRLFATLEEAQSFAGAWTMELAWDAARHEEEYRKVARRGKAKKEAVRQAHYEAEKLTSAKRHAALHDQHCEARWIEPYRDSYGDHSRAGRFTHCECSYRAQLSERTP